MAPIIDQTKGDWPCASVHGWKWSLIQSASNPASSARLAWSSSWSGAYSSHERK
jgi:hypothetical protein